MVVLRKRSKVRIDILAKTFIMTLIIQPKFLIINVFLEIFILACFHAVFFLKECRIVWMMMQFYKDRYSPKCDYLKIITSVNNRKSRGY